MALGVAFALVASVVAASALWMMRGTGERLADKIPGDVDFFAAVYLDPSVGQKANLARVWSRFPGLQGAGSEAGVENLLDRLFHDAGGAGAARTWLGSEVAVAGRMASGYEGSVFVLDVADPARAQGTLERAASSSAWASSTYGGATVWGVPQAGPGHLLALVGSTLVAGSDEALVHDVIDTAMGRRRSLASSPGFTRALEDLPDGKLAIAWLDLRAVVSPSSPIGKLASDVGLGPIDPGPMCTVAAVLSAAPDRFIVDIAVTLDPEAVSDRGRAVLARSGGNELLDWVPANAWVVGGTTVADEIVRGSQDQADRNSGEGRATVASLTGRAVLQYSPPENDAGSGGLGIVVGSADEAITSRELRDRAGAILKLSADLGFGQDVIGAETERTETYDDVVIHVLDTGDPSLSPSYAVTEGVGIVATSPGEVREMIDAHGDAPSITDDPTFQAAGGEEFLLHVAVARILVGVGGIDRLEDLEVDLGFERGQISGVVEPIRWFDVAARAGETRVEIRVVVAVPPVEKE